MSTASPSSLALDKVFGQNWPQRGPAQLPVRGHFSWWTVSPAKKEGEMKVGTTRVFCSFLFSGEENHFKIKKLLFPDNSEYFCLLNKSVVVEYGICLQIFGLSFNPFFDVF